MDQLQRESEDLLLVDCCDIPTRPRVHLYVLTPSPGIFLAPLHLPERAGAAYFHFVEHPLLRPRRRRHLLGARHRCDLLRGLAGLRGDC